MTTRFARLTIMSQRQVIPLLAAASLLAPACGETIDPSEGGFGDSASYSAAGETGGTGGSEGVGPGELEPGECVADPKDGVWGYKYQCGGYFMAHIGFMYEGEPGELWIPRFGETHFGDAMSPMRKRR